MQFIYYQFHASWRKIILEIVDLIPVTLDGMAECKPRAWMGCCTYSAPFSIYHGFVSFQSLFSIFYARARPVIHLFVSSLYPVNGRAYLGDTAVLDIPANHVPLHIAKFRLPETYYWIFQTLANIAFRVAITINVLFVTFPNDFTTAMDNFDALDFRLRWVWSEHPILHQTEFICRATDQGYPIHDAWWGFHKSSGALVMQQWRMIVDPDRWCANLISHNYHGIYNEY